MTVPSAPDLRSVFTAMDATWPAAETCDTGGWRVRRGLGGGGRVSTATLVSADVPSLAAMEAQHAAWGQPARVMWRPFDPPALDTVLAGSGYGPPEPTCLLCCATDGPLASDPPPLTAFRIDWPPLERQREIWDSSGIGAPRQQVMARCESPKITLLGRAQDRPVAAAFVAAHGEIAMLHALTVATPVRRSGVGRALMQAAVLWARDTGARWMSVQVDSANSGALAFYAALGMEELGRYSYRVKHKVALP